MSETPLTDEIERNWVSPTPGEEANRLQVMTTHARILEKRNAELAGAGSAMARLLGLSCETQMEKWPTYGDVEDAVERWKELTGVDLEQELNYIATHSQEVFEDLGKAEDEEDAALEMNGGGK